MPIKHNHKHDHCKHERLKYCADCQKPYCIDCGHEWNQYAYTYTTTAYNSVLPATDFFRLQVETPTVAGINTTTEGPTPMCSHTN